MPFTRESVPEIRQRAGRMSRRIETMVARAERENRDLTEDETRDADDILAEATAIRQRADRQEREEQAARDNAPPPAPRPHERGELDDFFRGRSQGRELSLDMRGAWQRAQRALSTDVATAGGNIVPTSFSDRLYQHMVESAAIRQTNITVLNTSGGEDLVIPKTTAHSAAAIVGEGDPIGESDPTFDGVTLGSFKYANLLKVTRELIDDTDVDLLGYLARDAGRALGDASGAHFVSGTGSGQPQGALTAATSGATSDSTTAVAAADIMGLYFSVISAYRRNGYWLMNDLTWSQVRKLRDDTGGAGTGAFLVGDLASGARPQLLGRPVVIDPNIPDPAADATPILFGDFGAYHVREVGSLRFERSDHAGFGSDIVWFRVIWRLDGRTVDTSGALKTLTMAAS